MAMNDAAVSGSGVGGGCGWRDGRGESERCLCVDQAGVHVAALDVDRGRIGRNGNICADRLNQAIANDHHTVRDFRPAHRMHRAAGDRVNTGRIGQHRSGNEHRNKQNRHPVRSEGSQRTT